MGRKRKHRGDNRDHHILKKLRRLEKEIYRRRNRSHSLTSKSESDQEDQTHCQNEYENTYYSPNNESVYESDVPQLATSQQKDTFNVISQVKLAEIDPIPGTSRQNDEVIYEEVTHLDDEVLALLGDAPKGNSPVGPDVHNDIASRLQDILQNGLKKEHKDKMFEDYPIPGNCPLFSAPILNAEVKAASSDVLLRKDASLTARQRQVGTVLTALAKSMDILVNDRSSSSQEVLKHVNGACRLLCDSQYIDTKLRRTFLISSLNNKLKDTLKECKRDKYLFGEDLSEKLKATKAITRSSQDLKYYKPKSTVNKTSTYTGPQSNLNWRHPQLNRSSPTKRQPPLHRSAGAPTSSHYRNRSRAGVESKRRPQPTRARANARYSPKRRY